MSLVVAALATAAVIGGAAILSATRGSIHKITIDVTPTSGTPPFSVDVSGVATNQFGQPMQRTLAILLNGREVGSTPSDKQGRYSFQRTFVAADFDSTGTAHISIEAPDGVSSPSVPITVSQAGGPPTDRITMSPNGNISLIEPLSDSSVSQVITGVGSKNGIGVPNIPLYTFVNGVQIPGATMTDGNGNYSTTIVFQPSSFPAQFLVDLADNISNI